MTLILASLALAFGLARLAVFICLHLVKSEYNIVEHAVSDYAVGSTRRLSNTMTWLSVPFWVFLAAAVATGLSTWSDATGVTICLAILALIFLILPFVPTNLEGEKLSLIGRLHYLMAIAWFALSYACMGNFVRFFTAEGMQPIAGVLNVISWIALVSLVISVIVLILKKLRPRVFGISERIFILAVNVFYIVVAIGIIAVATH